MAVSWIAMKYNRESLLAEKPSQVIVSILREPIVIFEADMLFFAQRLIAGVKEDLVFCSLTIDLKKIT